MVSLLTDDREIMTHNEDGTLTITKPLADVLEVRRIVAAWLKWAMEGNL